MCGIISIIARKQSGFNYEHTKMFEELLLLDRLRGEDSTGVFGVDRGGAVGVVKVASYPDHLFACDEWGKFRQHSYQNGKIMVGHNRAATKGAISTANAHPFHEGNIILVHNGTLRDDYKKTLADREVDSNAIAAAFTEKDASEVIPKLNGAFALVWYDLSTGLLNVSRNSERPLSLITTDDAYILCSEAWMGEVVCNRVNKKIESKESFEPGSLYQFDRKGSAPVVKKLNFVSTSTPVATDIGHGSTKTTGTDGVADNVQLYPKHIDSIPFHTNETAPYKKNEKILTYFKEGEVVDSGTPGAKKFVKMKGYAIEPGRPIVDVIGYIPYVEGTQQIAAFMMTPVVGRVVGVTSSTCGMSLYMTELTRAAMVDVYKGSISIREWTFITDNCTCSKCNAKIYDIESEFTKVVETAAHGYDVTCADCIEDSIENPNEKENFQQRRYGALQIGKPECEESAGGSCRILQLPGPTTIQ